MMTTLQTGLQKLRQLLRRLCTDPKVHMLLQTALELLAGFALSAAALSHQPQPLVIGLLCALSPGKALPAALGSAAGYLVFWGNAGLQGLLWTALGLALSLCAPILKADRQPLLLPVLAGLGTALSGLLLQKAGDSTAPLMYLLRIAAAMGSAGLFTQWQQRQDTIVRWLVGGVWVLALAQVAPLPWLCLGYPAAAALTVGGAFPAAALAGLALDIAGITSVPMTAVLSAAWLTRFIPLRRRWFRALAPFTVYPFLMLLSGNLTLLPLPGLLIGGFLGLLQPAAGTYTPRRGEVGVAQVRLELTASVLSQVQQLLMEQPLPAIDEEALILKACSQACGSCSARKNCPGRVQARNLSPQLLSLPLLENSLPFSCRRSGRLLQELRRSQEQLRGLRAAQKRQREYRTALICQYRFLSEYLQELSDNLSRRADRIVPRFRAEVEFFGNRAREDNGDHSLSFAGTGCRYYVLLCDGMGSGLGAVDEAVTAAGLLQKLLQAGFPSRYALSTLNSLCALRDKAGAVTVDLAELQLDTGRVLLYKWGAAPSWVLREYGNEKIGTAGPPPGIAVADDPEAAQRLSLRRGEILLLLSDGVGGEEILRSHTADPGESPAGLAARLLETLPSGSDDATVVTIRLRPLDLST